MIKKNASIIPEARIERLILLFRSQKVMLDKDLAELYGVTTGHLIEAVRRQLRRFPADFMFQLSDQEVRAMISQIAISNAQHPEFTRDCWGPLDSGKTQSNKGVEGSQPQNAPLNRRGGRRRSNPYAFTEQGVAMLSSVLNSQRAVDVNISIIRAFVRLRELVASHGDLARKLEELEAKYDGQFRIVFDAIRQLVTPSAPVKKGKLGFGP